MSATHLHVELALSVARHPNRSGIEMQIEAQEGYPSRYVAADEIGHHLAERTHTHGTRNKQQPQGIA